MLGLFLGAIIGSISAYILYLGFKCVFVKTDDLLKVMRLQDLILERLIRVENENKVLFNTNKFLGHNDITLADRITKLEENYAKSCSQKVAETICGDISARAQEYMANDQTCLHEE